MIFKRDLLAGLDELTCQVLEQGRRIKDLEEEVKRLKKKSCECKKDKLEEAIRSVTRQTISYDVDNKPKRRGRPVGSKNKKQPRDKSGKFVKK